MKLLGIFGGEGQVFKPKKLVQIENWMVLMMFNMKVRESGHAEILLLLFGCFLILIILFIFLSFVLVLSQLVFLILTHFRWLI